MEIGKLVQRLAIEIAVDEGLRDYWYTDTEGHQTIGIGFTKNAFVGLSEDAYNPFLVNNKRDIEPSILLNIFSIPLT